MNGDEMMQELWASAMEQEGTEATFTVNRERHQEGRSFSEPAMDVLVQSVVAFIGTRVMRRWDATQEPPTYLNVTITVDVG